MSSTRFTLHPLEHLSESARMLLLKFTTRPVRCRKCGCTDREACVRAGGLLGVELEPCHWIERDLCSACGPDAGEGWKHPRELREIISTASVS